jgi:hypothetical protein
MRKQLCALLLLCSAPALAAEKPPEIASVIHASQPYGEGTYSWMMIKAYDAILWTDAETWSMQSPFALVLHYRMHFTSKQLADRSIDEMRHIQPLSDAEAADYRAQLTRLFPDVKDGDAITALYIPHQGAQMFYNGKATGRITDDAFAQRFLNIWLSEKTSAPDLRKQLVGRR